MDQIKHRENYLSNNNYIEERKDLALHLDGLKDTIWMKL